VSRRHGDLEGGGVVVHVHGGEALAQGLAGTYLELARRRGGRKPPVCAGQTSELQRNEHPRTRKGLRLLWGRAGAFQLPPQRRKGSSRSGSYVSKINLLQLFIRKQYVKTFIRENELFIQSSSFKHNPSNRKSPRQIKSCHSRLISQLEYSDEYNIIGLL